VVSWLARDGVVPLYLVQGDRTQNQLNVWLDSPLTGYLFLMMTSNNFWPFHVHSSSQGSRAMAGQIKLPTVGMGQSRRFTVRDVSLVATGEQTSSCIQANVVNEERGQCRYHFQG